MKTLVNGCSFSRGPISWPYFLKQIDQSKLINLALSGAGNTYIHESTISELYQRSYDLVLIMWSGVSRVDLLVDNIDLFQQSRYTSKYQTTRNDWAEKIIEPINDQDYVDKNWIFGNGHTNSELAMVQSKAFDGIYRYTEYSQFLFHLGIKIISLQNTIKQLDIPYIFMFYQSYYNDLKSIPHIYNAIDWQNILIKDNIRDISVRTQDFDTDGNHPGLQSNKTWANLIDQMLIQKGINDTSRT